MATFTFEMTRMRRFAAAAAMASVLAIGIGVGTAAAQDQHSGGVSPNQETNDQGAPAPEVGGVTISAGSSGLPITGSDVAGLVAFGAVAIGVGSSAVVVSRRRAARAAV